MVSCAECVAPFCCFIFLTLSSISSTDYLEDNALTRAIASNYQTPFLGKNDLAIAKEILKRKFVVGLFDRMEESMERFETFFGWHVGDAARACQQSEISHMYDKHLNKQRAIFMSVSIASEIPPKIVHAFHDLGHIMDLKI